MENVENTEVKTDTKNVFADCVEEAKKWPGHYINVAWRTTEPYRKEGDKVYAQYHCFGGHYYWAEID